MSAPSSVKAPVVFAAGMVPFIDLPGAATYVALPCCLDKARSWNGSVLLHLSQTSSPETTPASDVSSVTTAQRSVAVPVASTIVKAPAFSAVERLHPFLQLKDLQ